MQRMTITIPRTLNNGKMVPVDVLDQIDRDILSLFGGYSRIDVYGQWTDDAGKVYRDYSYRYEILTDEPFARITLRDYARILCRILDQKCILTTCEDVQVDFIE